MSSVIITLNQLKYLYSLQIMAGSLESGDPHDPLVTQSLLIASRDPVHNGQPHHMVLVLPPQDTAALLHH